MGGEKRVQIMNDIINIAFLAVRHYAETHPRPTHVNQTQAAKMLGISPQTMGKIVRTKNLLNECGMIPIEKIDQLRAAK